MFKGGLLKAARKLLEEGGGTIAIDKSFKLKVF